MSRVGEILPSGLIIGSSCTVPGGTVGPCSRIRAGWEGDRTHEQCWSTCNWNPIFCKAMVPRGTKGSPSTGYVSFASQCGARVTDGICREGHGAVSRVPSR